MSALERVKLRAICERHSVTISVAPTADDREHWEAVILDDTGDQPIHVGDGECWFTCYDAPDDAVAECLKVRYGIRATTSAVSRKWYAFENGPQTAPFSAEHDTKLDAVSALADRVQSAALGPTTEAP